MPSQTELSTGGGHTVGMLGQLLSHPSLGAEEVLHTMVSDHRPPHHRGQPWVGLPDQPVSSFQQGASGRCRDCCSLSPSYLSVEWVDECSWQSCVQLKVTSWVPWPSGGGRPPTSWVGTPCPLAPSWSMVPPRMGFWPSLGRQELEVRKEVPNNAGWSRGGPGRGLPWVIDGAGVPAVEF